jgi:hypothetical protein
MRELSTWWQEIPGPLSQAVFFFPSSRRKQPSSPPQQFVCALFALFCRKKSQEYEIMVSNLSFDP